MEGSLQMKQRLLKIIQNAFRSINCESLKKDFHFNRTAGKPCSSEGM